MKTWSRFAIGFLVVLFAQGQPGFAAEEIGRGIEVAVGPQDVGGDPPSCGQDGICRVNECRNQPNPDPDCPDDLPHNPPAPFNSFPSRASDIHDCTAQETAEIAAAIDFGAEHWQAYKARLDDIRGWPVTIGNCLEERFQRNGTVVCERTMNGFCSNRKGDAAAWASPFNRRTHLCPNFMNRIRNLSGATTREACYFAIVTHEWGHTCERGHKVVEVVDDEAFAYWKSEHPEVVIVFGSGGCGLD